MNAILRLLLRGYQLCISPYLGCNCRFYPSCSEYMHQAISKHGTGAGMILGAKRLCRCHPWHPGGIDPVPEHTKNSTAAVSHCSPI